jgi:hypothetical protein
MPERNFQFRRRLAVVHKPGRRDPHVLPLERDTLIEEGWSILIPRGCSPVLRTAAQDLQDYLLTSMDVSVLLRPVEDLGPAAAQGERCIVLGTQRDLPGAGADLSVPRSYRLLCAPGRIVVYGRDERGVAQGSYYLEDLMNRREGPLVAWQEVVRAPLFSPRMVHSGWGLDAFPDAHLNAMAHAGLDAILVFVGHGREMVPFIDRTPKGYQDFNDLIDRAERYGLDVYAYSYLQSEKHPDDPGAEAYYAGTYGALFEHCPRFKGVILVGESVEFPSKDPHTTGRSYRSPSPDGVPASKPSPGWWPCTDYPEWLEVLKRAIRKHSPQADIVFWTYNWGWAPEEPRLALIRALPTDVTLLVTFEMFEQLARENVTNVCVDYTLAFEGPGQYFSSEARAAHERGLRLYTMCNTGGLTWDFGVVPYQPAPFQWGRRYQALLGAREEWGLSGLMESHHFGWWPSFLSELAKNAFWTPSEPIEEAATAIAQRDFGPEAAPLVVEAWRDWSEATRDYVPTNEDQYGPFRIGPAYPMLFQRLAEPPEMWHATFGKWIVNVNYAPHEGPRQSPGPSRFPVEIRSLRRMAKRWQQGVERLERALELTPPGKRPALEEMIGLGRFVLHSVRTTIHMKQWWLLKQELTNEVDPARAARILDRMVALGEQEIANAQATIPLVEADSRLGWEPTMEYMADRAHLEWKIAVTRRAIDHEIPEYRRSLGLTRGP